MDRGGLGVNVWAIVIPLFVFVAVVFGLTRCSSYMENIRMERQDKEGHYEISGTKVMVYENGGDCTYDVDPVTGMVSRIVRGARSVDIEPLNLTKEEFFKGLEEKGFTLYRGLEDEGTE